MTDSDGLSSLPRLATLEEHGDRVNAAHARYLKVRRLFLSQFICECVEFFVEFDEISRKYAQQGPAVFLRLACSKMKLSRICWALSASLA